MFNWVLILFWLQLQASRDDRTVFVVASASAVDVDVDCLVNSLARGRWQSRRTDRHKGVREVADRFVVQSSLEQIDKALYAHDYDPTRYYYFANRLLLDYCDYCFLRYDYSIDPLFRRCCSSREVSVLVV